MITYKTADFRIVSFLLPIFLVAAEPGIFAVQVTGTVREKGTDNGVEGARVRIQAATSFVETASDGMFLLNVPEESSSPILAVGKKGYFNAQSFDLIGGATNVRVADDSAFTHLSSACLELWLDEDDNRGLGR